VIGSTRRSYNGPGSLWVAKTSSEWDEEVARETMGDLRAGPWCMARESSF